MIYIHTHMYIHIFLNLFVSLHQIALYIYIYVVLSSIYMQNESRHNNKGRTKTSIEKYIPLNLFARVWKGYLRFYCERTEQKLQYFDPTLMAISVVSISFSWCSTSGPGAHSAGFLYYVLSATSLDPNSSGPQGPPPPGFSTTSCLLTCLNSNCLISVLTELYNSSTPTQSPTRSLEWHVWSSSSGNNCHAVHRSLSSGASVYECTMGILAYPILFANFHPQDFLS